MQNSLFKGHLRFYVIIAIQHDIQYITILQLRRKLLLKYKYNSVAIAYVILRVKLHDCACTANIKFLTENEFIVRGILGFFVFNVISLAID